MRSCWRLLLLLIIFATAVDGVTSATVPGNSSQAPATPTVPEPKTATDWFRRADQLTNIRMPGSAPFHLRVTFHAYPGMNFAKRGKSDIITGDGVYEEWWASPEKWRREVTLADYHAVEVRANGVRKMQASSDYEPSRVLMLLDALLYPVPRNLLEPRLEKDSPDWTVKHLDVGGHLYVRLSGQWLADNGKTYFYGYNFLPSGILIRADDETSMMTSWQGFAPFAEKIVPGQIAVQAMARDLLTATVQIEPLAASNEIGQLPGPAASPGMTLRPFHWHEVKSARCLSCGFAFVTSSGSPTRYALRQIVDRHGRAREVEVLATPDVEGVKAVLPHVQKEKFIPATVDGDPCEEIFRDLF